ncbi:hypothetical protein ACEW7V_00880 [Areca yellow leaf disease phytoplasma]
MTLRNRDTAQQQTFLLAEAKQYVRKN